MISEITHCYVYVLELGRAIRFYREKLGFSVDTDKMILGERWVSLSLISGPKVVLIPVEESMIFKVHHAMKMQELIREQVLSFGIFSCDDLVQTFSELKSKGVAFCIEPYHNKVLDEFEAVFFDDSQNWFRLTEKKT